SISAGTGRRSSEEKDPEDASREENGRYLLLDDNRNGACDDRNRPGRQFPPQSLLSEVPACLDDQRQDDWRDAIEKRAQLPVVRESRVERRDADDEEKRRQCKGHGNQKSSDDSETNVTAVNS